MTSDAKIGLLLGLVFIFVIAFVINGLPGLHHKEDSNKLTTNMVGLQSSQSGLGANERKLALENTAPATPVGYGQSQTAVANPVSAQGTQGQTDPRFQMALPQGTTNTQESSPAGTMTLQPTQDNITITPVQPTLAPAVDNTISTPAHVAPVAKPQTVKPASPQSYVVQDGDSLSSIAKKVYGEQAGSKLVNVNAIFEANKKTLASADDLQVGQKLIIPAMAGSNAPSPTPANVLPGSNFNKVESVGQRRSTTNTDKPAAPAKTDSPKTGKIYVVKEGDSLWRIAADHLGDGNRYKEIVKLNSLASEDDIQVGMQLKLPAK